MSRQQPLGFALAVEERSELTQGIGSVIDPVVPLLGVARGRASASAGSPAKTVWAVGYGPGGQVPMEGPAGGSETISMQIVLIDDQTGTFMRAYVRSTP